MTQKGGGTIQTRCRKKVTQYKGSGINDRGCDNRKKGTKYTHKVATSTPQKWGYKKVMTLEGTTIQRGDDMMQTEGDTKERGRHTERGCDTWEVTRHRKKATEYREAMM